MLETVLKICGVVSALAAVAAIGYKLYRWFRPGSAEISYRLELDGSGPDSISVEVTNRSKATIYLRSCSVRSTYPILIILWKHLRRPLLHPRLYPNLRYNGPVYQFVRREPVKVEPAQLIELKTDIYEHPANAIYGPMLIAKVVLTSGQVIRSKRMASPPVWQMIGRRGRNNSLPNE